MRQKLQFISMWLLAFTALMKFIAVNEDLTQGMIVVFNLAITMQIIVSISCMLSSLGCE